MELSEIKDKLEQSYNEQDWNIVEEVIDSLSYHVELNDYADDEWANPEEDEI